VQVQAGLDPARLEEAVLTICTEIKKIASAAVSKKELNDAKNNLIGRLALALEDSGVQAERTAKQFWFLPKVEDFSEVKKKVKLVTVSEVQKIAEELFDFSRMRLAVIGPLNKEKVLSVFKK